MRFCSLIVVRTEHGRNVLSMSDTQQARPLGPWLAIGLKRYQLYLTFAAWRLDASLNVGALSQAYAFDSQLHRNEVAKRFQPDDLKFAVIDSCSAEALAVRAAPRIGTRAIRGNAEKQQRLNGGGHVDGFPVNLHVSDAVPQHVLCLYCNVANAVYPVQNNVHQLRIVLVGVFPASFVEAQLDVRIYSQTGIIAKAFSLRAYVVEFALVRGIAFSRLANFCEWLVIHNVAPCFDHTERPQVYKAWRSVTGFNHRYNVL
mmetsp:Transcript_1388/g.3777  ORF Transcript_1388/g.3777 Transcript_1388/m.3777 type:complete len:258 (-) Transcript_1388:222-995(-)